MIKVLQVFKSNVQILTRLELSPPSQFKQVFLFSIPVRTRDLMEYLVGIYVKFKHEKEVSINVGLQHVEQMMLECMIYILQCVNMNVMRQFIKKIRPTQIMSFKMSHMI
jgi:hypothetical protein